jgi:hypothetical protein
MTDRKSIANEDEISRDRLADSVGRRLSMKSKILLVISMIALV